MPSAYICPDGKVAKVKIVLLITKNDNTNIGNISKGRTKEFLYAYGRNSSDTSTTFGSNFEFFLTAGDGIQITEDRIFLNIIEDKI